MTEVILHGALGKRFGRFHSFNIGKPIDAIRALIANKKSFRHVLKSWGRKGRLYEIICDGQLITDETELINPRKIKLVEIVPIIIGTSRALKIVVGAILVIVGAVTGINFFVNIGVALIVGGVMELLFPVQTPSFHTEAQAKSFLFSSTQNSTSRGQPVQIGYGRLRAGSQVISTSLEPSRLGGANTRMMTGQEREAKWDEWLANQQGRWKGFMAIAPFVIYSNRRDHYLPPELPITA